MVLWFFILCISAVFIVNRRHPAIKELAIESTNETNSVDEFVPENTETIEISPEEGTLELTKEVRDAFDLYTQ